MIAARWRSVDEGGGRAVVSLPVVSSHLRTTATHLVGGSGRRSGQQQPRAARCGLLRIARFQGVVIKQLFYEVYMRHHHSPAEVHDGAERSGSRAAASDGVRDDNSMQGAQGGCPACSSSAADSAHPAHPCSSEGAGASAGGGAGRAAARRAQRHGASASRGGVVFHVLGRAAFFVM